MNPNNFKERKTELLKKLKESSELTDELKELISEVYETRGKKAIDVVENGGVFEENGRWFVRGKGKKYEIVRTHCTCLDYVLNVVTNKAEADMCYHGLAKTIVQLIRSG